MSAMLSQNDRRRHVADEAGLHTFELPHGADEAAEKTITVRLADCDGERSTANMLINRKYSGRGYGANHKVPTQPSCVTFTASSNASLIGTLSLTVDSPEGLASDRTFKEELDAFRAVPGSKLCELTKFAFDTSKPSMHLLASLFHIIFIYGTHHYNCTDLFIEVNPRHRRFYQAMLGFQMVGKPRTNEAVGAPSYLMSLKVSEIRRMIDAHKRNPGVAAHSLYGYFFSMKEEIGIYDRLVRPQAEPRPLARSNRIAAGAAKVRKIAASTRRQLAASRRPGALKPATA
jgi:hypothetical protein